MATLKLDLRKTLRELEELKAFLASEDADRDIAQWRRERESIAAERARIAEERKALDAERKRVQRAIIENQPLDEPADEPAAPAEPQPDYELDYKLSYIRNEPGSDRPTYIEIGDLLVPSTPTPGIDPSRVRVRGTLQNRSKASWRYTFEVRLADRAGNLLGRWRYQTPILEPNELHPFDLDVPVSDALRITRYQIGNIEADRPAKE